MKSKLARVSTYFFLSQILANIVYGYTFVQNIVLKHSVINDIINDGTVNSKDFSIDSPLNYLIPAYLGIKNNEIFLLFLFFITNIFLFLICYKIAELGKHSYLFLFGGWLVPSVWFIGYGDMLTVALTLFFIHEVIKNDQKSKIKIFIFSLLLVVNHSALALGLLLSIFFLTKNERKFQFIKIVLPTYFIGYFINQQLKSNVGFDGRGRFRFLLNEGVVSNSLEIITKEFINIIYSGFLGFIILFIVTAIFSDSSMMKKTYIPILISIAFTSISLDTSRIFSVLLVPVLYVSMNEYDKLNFKNYWTQNIIPFGVIATNLIIGTQHVYGYVREKSPFTEEPNVYDLIIKYMDSILSGVLA
tara:strand:+ start:219 stop:1295 length:1077 start_codon:yes stop_codon:yes gene_type:complete